MANFRNFIKTGKSKIIVVAIALLTAIMCCVMANQFLGKKDNSKNIAQKTENYAVEKNEKLTADATVQSGTVTVHYVDESGKEISDTVVREGNVGEEYEVKRKNIELYTSTGEEPFTRAGNFEIGNIDVTFVYKLASKEARKRVENQGEDGATANNAYIVFNNTKSQRDYKLKIITKDEKGNPISGGVFKISQAGEVLREGQVRNGSLYAGKIALSSEGKTTYQIEQTKATSGYNKVNGAINLGLNITWNEDNKKFEVTLDGIALSGVTARLNGEDEIIIEVVNEKIKDMYEMQLINKSGTELITGGKFKITKAGQTIVEDYTQNGLLRIGEFEITNEEKEKYIVYEEETADGYKKVLDENNVGVVEVTKKYNQTNDKYDISVEYSNIPGFTAEVSNNGMITIYVESEEDNKIEYDLAIKKFVSAIDGVETIDREPDVKIEEVEENEEKVKKIVYEQNNDIEQAANEQEVEYTLRTYNESATNGVGRRIVEYIPDGLVYLPENETNKEFEWKMYKEDEEGDLIEANEASETTVVISDYLIDKEIEGFNIEEEKPKYADIKVVFQIDESKIKSKDRIVENTVEIDETNGNKDGDNDGNGGENGKEINIDNNKTTEKIYVKFFDLDVTKYIKEVTVKNSLNTTTQKVGEEQKGKLIKIDVAKDEVKNTTIRVTYVLKVKNIGEIEGYATELVDYIPADFKLVEDGTWKIKEDKAVTTKLKNTLLKPGESTTIEITFDWKLTEDNIGSRINEGKITKYENIYNAKDPTEDNNDKEEMLVQVRTGSTWVFKVVAALVALWMIVGIIFLLRKAKENREEA